MTRKTLSPAFTCILGLLLILSGCIERPDKQNRLFKIKDMIALSHMSHESAIEFIVNERKGILVANHTLYKQQVTEFSWSKGDSSASIVKTQWQDGNQLFHMVHCDFLPVSYVKQILGQLKYEGFLLKEKNEGGEKSYRVYKKGLFTVSIYLFAKKSLPLSVELHKLF